MRDVDLSNVNFQIKIADFGFSKKLKNKGQINKTICGTPLYMAPQVVQKTQYSYKSDIWSIGCILFELINGLTPFHSKNRQEFEGKVAQSDYQFKDHTKESLTLETISFLTQCLQHNEQQRKCITELVQHPYIVTAFADQQKLTSKHLSIFLKQSPTRTELITANNKIKRANSAFTRIRPENNLVFNAKDKNQLERIDIAIAEARLMTEKTRDDTLKAETLNSEQEKKK